MILLIARLLPLSTLVHAQERKRVRTTTIFEIHNGSDSKTDTLTKKITSFSFDSTIIDQTVITSESNFFGFPMDYRDSIVLKDKRVIFHLMYGNKNQPLYVVHSSYQFNKHNQVIEETDSVYTCHQLTDESKAIIKDSLYTIRKTTYHYNKLKQLVREIKHSDILIKPSFTEIQYSYNRKGQLKKSIKEGVKKEVSRFSYNSLGLLVKTTVRSSVSGTVLFFYDDRRRMIKKVENFSNGKATLIFDYNENGEMWRQDYFNGESHTLKIVMFQYY